MAKDRRSKEYKDAMQRTIPDDNERQRVLNRERNRSDYEHFERLLATFGRSYVDTLSGAPTQTLNPLTGEGYDNAGSRALFDSMPEFMRYQLTLARKDRMDGKMSSGEYHKYISRMQDLVFYCNEIGLPVEAINTAEGLAKAIESDWNWNRRRVDTTLADLIKKKARAKESNIYNIIDKMYFKEPVVSLEKIRIYDDDSFFKEVKSGF